MFYDLMFHIFKTSGCLVQKMTFGLSAPNQKCVIFSHYMLENVKHYALMI